MWSYPRKQKEVTYNQRGENASESRTSAGGLEDSFRCKYYITPT